MSTELARQVEQVEVSDEQRTKLYAALTQDPYRGQLKACRDSGIVGTGGQLRDWFKADPAVQEHLADARNEYLRGKRLDIDTLLGKVSAIVHNDESPSQWRATDWAFAVLHRMGAKQAVQVEHTGPEGGPVEVTNPDVAAALDRFTTTIRRLSERAQPGGDLRPADPVRAELPAGNTGG